MANVLVRQKLMWGDADFYSTSVSVADKAKLEETLRFIKENEGKLFPIEWECDTAIAHIDTYEELVSTMKVDDITDEEIAVIKKFQLLGEFSYGGALDHLLEDERYYELRGEE